MFLAILADVVVGQCFWCWWDPWVVYLQGAMPTWVSNFERKGRPTPPKIAQPCHMIAGQNQYHTPASTHPDPKAWNFTSEISAKSCWWFSTQRKSVFCDWTFVATRCGGWSDEWTPGGKSSSCGEIQRQRWKKTRNELFWNKNQEKIDKSNQKVRLTENLGIKRCRGNETFQLCVAYLESILGYPIEPLSHAVCNGHSFIAQVQVASIPARVWSC